MEIEKTTELTFGEALEFLKEGKIVQRSGWNGKGMFIFMRPKDELQTSFIIDKVKSIPDNVKVYLKACVDLNPFKEDTSIEFTEYLCLKTADNKIMNGWTPNMLDILAEDWTLFNV